MTANKREAFDQEAEEMANDLKAHPDSPDVHIELGDNYMNNGEYDKAIREFKLILEKHPNYADVRNRLGNAYSDKEDAFGCYTDFTIGGLNENATADNEGPDIDLFINNYNFVSGDLTHENPLMIAHISDENGINLSTNGIGHEISLVMNNDFTKIMQITDLFVPDTNSYQSGSIQYPFYKALAIYHYLQNDHCLHPLFLLS